MTWTYVDFTPARWLVAKELGVHRHHMKVEWLVECVARMDARIDAGEELSKTEMSVYRDVRWFAGLPPRMDGFGSVPDEDAHAFVTSRFRAGRERSQARIEYDALKRHLWVLDCLDINPRKMPPKNAMKPDIGVNPPFDLRYLPWWVLAAPPAPLHVLPESLGFDQLDQALKWPGTLWRVNAIADACDGPARWARDWTCNFYAECTRTEPQLVRKFWDKVADLGLSGVTS